MGSYRYRVKSMAGGSPSYSSWRYYHGPIPKHHYCYGRQRNFNRARTIMVTTWRTWIIRLENCTNIQHSYRANFQTLSIKKHRLHYALCSLIAHIFICIGCHSAPKAMSIFIVSCTMEVQAYLKVKRIVPNFRFHWFGLRFHNCQYEYRYDLVLWLSHKMEQPQQQHGVKL